MSTTYFCTRCGNVHKYRNTGGLCWDCYLLARGKGSNA